MLGVLAALVVLAVLAGCAAQGPAVVVGSPTAAFDPFGAEPRIRVQTARGLVALNNGDALEDNGLGLELFFDPHPPRSRTNLDLRVTDAATGQAIDNAEVTATLSMALMEHGNLIVPGDPAGGGHYLIRMTFAMADEWTMDVRVQTRNRSTQFTLRLLVGL